MQYGWIVLNHATDPVLKLLNNVECMTRAYCLVLYFLFVGALVLHNNLILLLVL
jgi:hypothetical protein